MQPTPARPLIVSYKERVIAEAARELAEKTRKRPADRLQIFKNFLKIEEHRLRMWHNAGGGGREIARQRADLVDILFRELFDTTARDLGEGRNPHEPFAVAAFGGYGRREMNPFSDVDVMFVHARSRPSAIMEEIIRQTLLALWDLGFKVGHSTRSISQAVKQANEDPLTKTSMLECRFLTGEREVFSVFKERFEKECINGKEDAYIAWRLANQHELHEKYGSSVFMQEPNVKNGCGGLRDYQHLLWLAYFKERIGSMSKLVEKRHLRDSERRRLDKAYDFLLRVRTEMHYINRRPIDSLTLQLQGRVATGFHYPQKHILRRCEAFMRDYYSHTREIFRITQTVIERMQIAPRRSTRNLLSFFAPRPRTERFDGFVVKDGQLLPSARDIFNHDPFRILRAFQYAQVRQLDLSAELSDLIHRRLRLIDRTFQYARIGREIFLAILSRKGDVSRILRAMHDVEFLGRYLPEFGALTCLVQHEFYHRYTADEHTLVCIEKLDSIILSEDAKLAGYRSLFQKLEDPSILYLALLLHDTGKAANTRNHEEASAILAHKVARRLQLSPERRRMLITLVDAHYTLSHAAQTRNLEDPTTIEEFASIVQNRQNLDALMLLTLADGMGTSDKAWSDWKEALVWSLYRKTSQYLEAGPDYFDQWKKDRLSFRESVTKQLPKDFADEIAAHFEHMPERYFQAFEPDEIADHLRLFRTFFEQRLRSDMPPLAPSFRWIPRQHEGHTEVWICGWDREGLLERIAGAFLSAQINILSADIFTRGDNVALDIFRVCDTRYQPVSNQKDISRVESRLIEAFDHEDYDFSPLIDKEARMQAYRISHEADLPTRITVENSSHPIFTLVEIQTPDRIGLLYALLRAFSDAGVSIDLSRITTEKDVALDTFYITGRDGKKITDSAAIKRLQRLLQQAAARPMDG